MNDYVDIDKAHLLVRRTICQLQEKALSRNWDNEIQNKFKNFYVPLVNYLAQGESDFESRCLSLEEETSAFCARLDAYYNHVHGPFTRWSDTYKSRQKEKIIGLLEPQNFLALVKTRCALFDQAKIDYAKSLQQEKKSKSTF